MGGTSRAVTTRALTLSGLLKQEVEKSQHSVRAIAQLMGVSHPTILRWTDVDSNNVPDAETVATMLAHLGVHGEAREDILAIARKSGEPDWLTTGKAGISQQLAGVMELERTATGMIDWSPLFVPGMLQTANYARAILSKNPHRSEVDVEHIVNVRLGRQNAIVREQPIKLTAILGESAIHGLVGGPLVMVEQLRHLRKVSKLASVRMVIVPRDGDWHGGLMGPYLMYERPNLPTVLHCEHHSTGTFVTDRSDVARYEELTSHLLSSAWNETDSRAQIEEQLKIRETK